MCCTLDTVHKIFIVSSCSSRIGLSAVLSCCHSVRRIYCEMYTIAIIFLALIYILFLLGEYLAKMFPRSVTTCWLSGDFYLYTHNNSYSHFYNCSRAGGRNFLRLNDWWGEKETQTATTLRRQFAFLPRLLIFRAFGDRAREFCSRRKGEKDSC